MNSIVCTLYEGHYDIGVGALINSLACHNFKGRIVVGYRGELPNWLPQLGKIQDNYLVNKSIELIFVPLTTDFHLTYYKPFLMLDLFENFPECDRIFYFDPDICNKCSWDFYEKWVTSGVAVCLDCCYAILPAQHPWRFEWSELGKKLGYEQKQALDFYFNAGFVGAQRSNKSVLEIWKELTISLVQSGYNIRNMKDRGRENAIFTDQDILNASFMFSDVKCAPIGPEGMDFIPGGFLMSHAACSEKPWRKQFTLSLISTGNITSAAEAEFFNNIAYPINLYSPTTRLLKKLDLKLSKFLGRIIGH